MIKVQLRENYFDKINNVNVYLDEGDKYHYYKLVTGTRTVSKEVTEEIPYNRTKCTFIKLDENGNETNEGFSFIGRDNLDLEHKIVAPLGTQYLLNFDDNAICSLLSYL